MGWIYKGYQHTCHDVLKGSREKGIEVDKKRIKEEQEKRDKEFKDNIGINWGRANKLWQNFD